VSTLKDGGTRKTYSTGATKEDNTKTEGKGAYHLLPVLAIREVAEIFRKGALKYSEWNWEAGLPLSRFIDSGKRHWDQEWEGLIDEKHAAQACWNALCYLQTLLMIQRGILPPTLDDRPSYGKVGDPNYRPAGIGFKLSDEDKGKWPEPDVVAEQPPNCTLCIYFTPCPNAPHIGNCDECGDQYTVSKDYCCTTFTSKKPVSVQPVTTQPTIKDKSEPTIECCSACMYWEKLDCIFNTPWTPTPRIEAISSSWCSRFKRRTNNDG